MFLKSVILPFKYFFLGIYTVIMGIINYSILGLQLIFKVFKTIVIGLGQALKFLLITIFNMIKQVVLAIGKALKVSSLFLIKYFKLLMRTSYNIIKKIIIMMGRAIKVSVVFIFNFLKQLLLQIIRIIGLIFKYLGHGLLVLLKQIGLLIKKIYFGVKKVFQFGYKLLVNFFKLISKIPVFMWHVLKKIGAILYKVVTYPFIFIYTFIKKIMISLWDLMGTIGGKVKEALKGARKLPQLIKVGLGKWYNNLTFVKDRRNRLELKRQTLLIDFEKADVVRGEQMVRYRFVAKNADGKIEKGKLSAYSRLDVHSYLLAEGYEVYEIEAYKGFNFGRKGYAKVKTSELTFIITQLSTYIKAGIPLVDAIKILEKQTKRKDRKDLYRSIVYELTMGESLSEAFAKQGKAFPKLLINMIKSAELAGNLPATLDDMADYYTVVHNTRRQMISAMTYPTVIFVFALAVITFIMVFVIPEFVSIYKDMGTEIPTITRITIVTSDFLQQNVIYLLVGVVAVITGLVAIFNNVKMFKTLIQWLLMHLPIIGKIIIYNEVTMFAKTFASLLNHNVFITDSMEILSKITNNEVYKMLIFDTITNLARGDSISNSFKDHWAFPIVAYEMLLTGERTGQPGPMMDKVANFYQEEHRIAVNQVKTFIEPVMIVFITVIVGFILLSVIMPMFQLYGDLK